MSAPQFTPGPWTVDPEAFPYSPPSIVIAKPDGTVMAEAFGDDATWHENKPEVEANARLIAAAPKLYSLVEASLFHLRLDSRAEAYHHDALAALAEIRGDQ